MISQLQISYVNVSSRGCEKVTWYVPVNVESDAGSGTQGRTARLTQVRRRQHFLTYLAAIHRRSSSSSKSPQSPFNSATSSVTLQSPGAGNREQRGQFNADQNAFVDTLETISWSVDVQIDIDPSKPLGQRVKQISPARQRPPTLLKPVQVPALAENALRPPNANSSQALIWWPLSLTSVVCRRPLDDADSKDKHHHQQLTTLVNRSPKVVVQSTSTVVTPDAAAQTYLNARSGHIERLMELVSLCRIDENLQPAIG